MSHVSARHLGAAIGLWIAGAVAAAPTCGAADAAAGAPVLTLAEDARLGLLTRRPYRARDFGFDGAPDPRQPVGGGRRARLDLSPVLEGVLDLLQEQGLPLRERRDEEGKGLIGVMAAVSVGRDVPAVSFHLGDRPVEPLGAFYTAERGFRCAVVWPIDRFTLRIEGGEDSEFGYYGIAGLQWLHPRKRLAIGVGVPMNLRDPGGGVGLILQLRMPLD